jgi:hypothetical protein
MYVRMSTRRRLYHVAFLLVALVLLAPKLDLPATSQLSAILHAVGLGQSADQNVDMA